MHTLTDFIIMLADLPIYCWYFGCYFQTKPSADKNIIFYIKLFIVITTYLIRNMVSGYLDYGHIYMVINVATYILLIFLIADVIFQGSRLAKLLLTLLSGIFIFFVEFLVYLILFAIFKENYFSTEIWAIHYGGMIASKFLEITIVFFLNKRLKISGRLWQETSLFLRILSKYRKISEKNKVNEA